MANPLSRILSRLIAPKPSAPQSAPVARVDGWENPVAGWGTERDKLQAGYYAPDWPLQWSEISNLYYGDVMAAKIVNLPIREAFRKGYTLSAKDGGSAKDLQKWAKKRYKLDAKLQEASIWGRLWGGALLVFGLNDGQDLDKPLNAKGVKSLDWILPIDRRYCQPISYERELGPRLGQPVTYRVSVQGGQSAQSATVHHSRVVVFRGDPLDPIRARIFGGWDQSVLQRPYKVLRDFASAFQGAGLMLSDASQGVFKLKNLIGMLASGERALLHERMTMLDMGRSTARSIIVDADAESFEKVATQFSGVPELLDRYMQLLSAATDTGYGGIPVSVLMGRSAAGMNATGDLDIASFHATVQALQTYTLEPLLEDCYKLLALAPDCPQTEELAISWEPLSVPTDAEDSTAYSTRANADIAYINAGVLDPAQVAIARFGKGEYSTAAPSVDVEALQRELTAAASFDPPPAPVGGAPDNAPPAPGNAPPSPPPAPGEGAPGDEA